MSNAIGSSRELNPSRRICLLCAITLGYVDDIPVEFRRLQCSDVFILFIFINFVNIYVINVFDRSENSNYDELKSNLHYARGITPKRVTSGGAHLRGLAPGNTSPKKCRSGAEPLATLCPI